MNKDNYFKALTGYRAIAAYMVFCVHFNWFPKGSFAHDFVSGFGAGVPMFFVLSGFLIYTRYNTSDVNGGFYKKYMLNRFARIYPVYFLITTATWLFNYKKEAFSFHWLKVYILNITFLRGFFQDYVHSLVAPGWSLTVEEVFYFLAPILFLIGWHKINRFLILFIVIISFGWLCSFISIDMLHGYFWADYKFMMVSTFFGHSFAFTVGIITAVLNDRMKEVKFKYFSLIGIVGILISLLLLSQLNDMQAHGELNFFTWKGIMVYNFLIVPFIGALIWGLIREQNWLSKLLSTNTFQWLGKSSYSFYLIHFGIIQAIINKFVTQNVFGAFVILVICSLLVWRFVEEPLNEAIRGQLPPAMRP